MPQPNRLKVLRAERGATQTKVARALKISQTRYCHIENGRIEPTPKQRERLAKTFGVTVADIWQESA